jgi:RNA polymerase sigma-70 factor (ECF subfamily)
MTLARGRTDLLEEMMSLMVWGKQNGSAIKSRREAEFVKRYAFLLRLCMALVGNNRADAEDLLHDAFIKFLEHGRDIESIHNIDAYLVVVCKHVYYSLITKNRRKGTVPFEENEVTEVTTRRDDLWAQMYTEQMLIRIFLTPHARKGWPRASVVLILRFVHGYTPSEIAQVMHCSVGAVNELLRRARKEVRHPDEQRTLPLLIAKMDAPKSSIGLSTNVFLEDLREIMLRSAKDNCLPAQQLRELYTRSNSLPTALMCHIVRCARCLNEVNELLHLPLLADRDPMETLRYNRQRLVA